MTLRTSDFQTEFWARLRATLEGRLQKLRTENDEPSSPEETALLRGRIAEIRYILALPQYDERARDRQRYMAQASTQSEVGSVSDLY